MSKTITGWDYVPAGDVKEGDIIDCTAYWGPEQPHASVVWVDTIEHSSDIYGVGSVTFNGTVTYGRKRHVYVLRSIDR